jgi:phosphoadenosine phosphosulfate reductase
MARGCFLIPLPVRAKKKRIVLAQQVPDVALAIENAARELEDADPKDILRWALQTYAPRIVLACSFGGPTGIVALDLAMKLDRTTPVYYLDTGLLFPETYALIDRLAAKYDIAPMPVRPELGIAAQEAAFGPELWKRDPDACCSLRKLEPQSDFLNGYDAWISGIRRDQTLGRRSARVVQWDPQFGLVKINPLASWDEAKVWAYIRFHDLPVNELHERGYASIGCTPCTRSIGAGEDLRAGRWSGFGKTECGLHR